MSTTAASIPLDPPPPTLLRPPQQARSRRTLERLLAAALDLLEAEGPDALTVTGITRKARTSVGSFYARFDGKDALLRYLGESSLQETLEVVDDLLAALPAGDLRARVRPAVLTLLDCYLEGPARPVLLLDGVQDPVPTRRWRLEDHVAGKLAGRLPGAPERTELAGRVLLAVLREVALRRGRDGADPFEPEEHLASELVELLVGYLGGQVRKPEPRGTEAEGFRVAPGPVREPGPGGPASAPEPPEREEPEPGPKPSEIDPFDVWE